jgi:DNA-binding NtrC family response regulator
MLVSIQILEPPGQQFGDLRRDFRAEAPVEWPVQIVSSTEELLHTLSQNSGHQLVLLPETFSAESPLKKNSSKSQEAKRGLDLIPPIRNIADNILVVVVSDCGSVESTARAIAAGASDFLVLGNQLRQRIATLLGKLHKLFEVIDRNRLLDESNANLRDSIQARLKILGESPQIKQMMKHIQRVAQVPRPVLIVGERGTGKELVARAIHFAGGSSSRPIVTVNCAAFNDALLESELFGHEKGAFTGADSTRRGKFEQADGGTLFLDEIGNMSLSFQEKILRVVEYGTYSRVGGSVEMKSDARIIAATNRDLTEGIRQGKFLADLYDRLTFETIHVPPLRERTGDIDVLARYYLDRFARETSAYAGKTFSREAMLALNTYRFPGNVRELKNIVERAACRCTSMEISPDDLGLVAQEDLLGSAGSFSEKMRSYAQRLIAESLKQSDGNQAQAARTLGLPYHRFRYYRRKYCS